MSYLVLGLLLIGALLLVAEVFVPGFGVCGISGLLLVLAASVLTIVFIPFGYVIVLFELAGIGAVLWAFVNYVRKKQLHGQLILEDTVAVEEKEIGDLSYFLGKEGITKTPLKPFGTVDFNGVSIEVYSEGDYVLAHKKVKVVNISERKIIVRQCNTN